jgi:hypothetical protein
MSTKRTIINADEELVIKGKLTIEGNVTQIETTQRVTNLQGNVFTINSDSSNTSAVLALNSNGTVASFTFDSANGNLVVSTPINFGSNPITGNLVGNVTGFVSNISNHTTTSLAEGTNLYFTEARARGSVGATDAGGDGSFSYNSSTGVFTYTGPSATEVRSHISVTDAGGDGSLAYNSSTGVITYTGPSASEVRAHISAGTGITFSSGVIATTITQYTDALARAAVSASDAGGDGSFSYNSSTGVFTYTGPSAAEVRAHITDGDGIDYANGSISVDSTVIRTAGEQTITGNTSFVGNVSITGNLDVTANINSLNVVDLNVQDTQIILNANAASGANSNIAVNRGGDPTVYIKWNESIDAWTFTNNGTAEYLIPTSTTDLNEGNNLYFTTSRVNTAIDAYIIGGNGLTYSSGTIAVAAGTGITVNADNVAVDNTVIRTTGDQTVTGNTTFVGTLIIPSSNATANGAIFTRGPQVFAYVDGIEKELTPQVDIGVVTTADAGNTGIDVYAGLQMVGNVTTHFIRSIDGGTYTTSSVASNVITIDGNITAIRGSLSTANVAGYGNLSYNSSNGLFSYSGVTDSQIRTLFSGSGLITYNSANGSITTSADNYGSWTVETDSGAGATKTISSSEKLTIQGGTNITVTNTGNVITIVNDNVADIESVAAGDGLTGGGNSGNVTLNIGAGDGITVNADNVAVNVAFVRNQFSTSGDLSYNASTGVFSFTNDAGDIEGVTAGNGLTGGGTSGTVTLNIGAGDGITVNADDVAVNATYVKGLFSASDSGGDGSFSYSNGVFTYTGPSQAEANTRIDARLSGGTGITYTSGVIATTITQYTDALARAAVSVTDAGGDGSLSYNSSTGVITYTGPSASEVRAHITGGDGLTFTSGTMAVGAGSYITVAADTVAVDATTTATVSKVVARDGAGNVYANYFVGTATAAQYADLAENYLADAEYAPGTVLVFGGEAEVTAAITYDSTRVAGVVTTQPAHVMNSHLEGPNVACIALRGRVPVKVKGVVCKGDVLVSAGEGFVGYAVAALYPRDVPAAAMVGKAIGDKLDAGLGVVEALI